MDISHLNKQQQLAIHSTEGKVRVIAGAGTGKTLVLVNRYAYLVNVLGIDPHNILCLTFTNKAAKEMRIRLTDKFGINIYDNYIGTLHGFCLNFLRENCAKIGLTEGFTVMDREDSVALAKDVLKQKRNAKSFVYEVSDWKYSISNDYLTIINNARKQGKDNSFANPICQFVNRQQEQNSVDYDDLILYTYSLLISNKDICNKWTDKYDYIMVDEAQDCSMIDWEIINKLSTASGNLFVVGDPDQCIYQWRGAAPKYLVEFKPDVDIVLNENYRSSQGILDIANDVISHNEMRVPKDLFSHKNNGIKPEFYYLQNENKEGEKIAHTIIKEHKTTPYKQMAVLYRNSSVSNHIERALISERIPYTIWGGVRFYERKEIKDVLAYLKLIVSKDDLAFKRIVNVPSRHIGPVTLNKIKQTAQEHNTCLIDALPYVDLRKDNQISLLKFKKNISELTDCSFRGSIAGLIDKVVDKFHLNNWYEEERIENIEELKRSSMLYMEEMQKQNKASDLKSFLQDISLYTNIDQEFTNDAVRLMTIHQSKGLEFSCVILCGLTDGVLPSKRTMEDSGSIGLEEERRLMYVALTRAKDRLYLTDSKGFSYYGEKRISRFIDEIKQNHLNIHIDTIVPQKEEHPSTDIKFKSAIIAKKSELYNNNIFGPFEHGNIVRHYKHGVCVFDKYIKDQKCTIIHNNKTIETIESHIFKLNKSNYNFTKGQWVKSDTFGIGVFVKDLDLLNCIINCNGKERSVIKYELKKIEEEDLLKNHHRYQKDDIIRFNNIYAEVYECDADGIKYHVDNNNEHDGILHDRTSGVRLVLHPIKNRTYWAKDNNKLTVFVYKYTMKDSKGISLIGEDGESEKIVIGIDEFCKLKFKPLKQDLFVLKNIYAKISDENIRISMDSCITDKINDPCSQLDKIIAGDIVKINTKYYYFISKEKCNMLCKNITNHKQVTIPDNNVEIIVRPYTNMFYKSQSNYYYFNGFKIFGTRLCFSGIVIDRGKCTPSCIGVGQINKKNLTPCTEKDFWENCKDKIGYISYRYNIRKHSL